MLTSPPKRRSIRLPTVDDCNIDGYFITLCVAGRLPLFGNYQQQHLCLNAAGHMIDDQWRLVLSHFSQIMLDAYVVMPDHFHAIVDIDNHQPVPPPLLGELVRRFKYRTTFGYFSGVQNHHWPMCHRPLWQRNYYEHIIRNEQDWQACQAYILHNPDSSAK